MTCKDIEWLSSTVSDFMKALKTMEAFTVIELTAFSNPEQMKIPIRYQLDHHPPAYLVLDYYYKNQLEKYEKINDFSAFIRLSCYVPENSDMQYIDYYVNTLLTKALNKKLNS